jgi:hypothetical protein
MALVIADRVRETSTTTGTGTLTLDGAVTGYRTFSSGIGNSNTCYYAITLGSAWEVGIGTVSAGQLARTTVLKSSNADAAVSFAAGTKDVFATYAGDKAVDTDVIQTLSNKTLVNPAVVGASSTVGGKVTLKEGSANGSNYVELKAADSLAGNVTYTLPTADGTSGQLLATNGTGTLSWSTPSSGGASIGVVRAIAINCILP